MIGYDEALRIINNTATRDILRKYQPQWCTIVINTNGEIIDILKHKEEPSPALNREHLQKYPNTYQITAWQGRFNSKHELIKAIKEAAELGNKY